VPRLFGTDGVRGLANGDVLTAGFALDLAVAAAGVLLGDHCGVPRPVAVVGRDPRASGEFLEAAVVAGLAGAGVDVLRVGVLPTPAVALLTALHDAEFGVMLSASHNPAPDNGIKFFARGGHKLPDSVEDAIEAALGRPGYQPTGAEVGRVVDRDDAGDEYVDHLLSVLPHRLDGLKVVVDCANGAASVVAPEALRRAGAEVVVIGAEPDGLNINSGCGSTHLETLQAAVREHHADAGIAHDGDADRCLAVDASGTVVDGDQVLAILALAARERGVLARDTLVVTVMSNLGLKLAMRDAGITLVETAVGDRYVLEAMREGGFTLGGEQSGHVVMLDHGTTGDGPLTALMLLARIAETGKPLAELASVMTRLPQVLVNVPGVDRTRVAADAAVLAAVDETDRELGETGRVLLRPSGTEPVVRVMVEAPTLDLAQQHADRLAAVVLANLAL
ncbi:MAG: phosphoglucosamine mutase, partial [Frankiales bacterium]|jgi:phosphoglucosamine mutase|nr:phosphoglucosamine mutase [Frankiales bacterium]